MRRSKTETESGVAVAAGSPRKESTADEGAGRCNNAQQGASFESGFDETESGVRSTSKDAATTQVKLTSEDDWHCNCKES